MNKIAAWILLFIMVFGQAGCALEAFREGLEIQRRDIATAEKDHPGDQAIARVKTINEAMIEVMGQPQKRMLGPEATDQDKNTETKATATEIKKAGTDIKLFFGDWWTYLAVGGTIATTVGGIGWKLYSGQWGGAIKMGMDALTHEIQKSGDSGLMEKIKAATQGTKAGSAIHASSLRAKAKVNGDALNSGSGGAIKTPVDPVS